MSALPIRKTNERVTVISATLAIVRNTWPPTVLTSRNELNQRPGKPQHRLVGAVMSSTPSRLKHPHCRKKHYPSSTYLTHV
ncbi:hypothetical protein PFLUV_G00164000 [Perca fluviatilis]|uniref:Uncharacterized protein n=1 Tax=Perca fluviatilis TaxID=8168 RepID=A0A6A5EWL4_PERFL|nr:hypothetical protein PFLUV_G00164000 [Perca fluviatilis]